MRAAVFSDVHGNLPALEKVIKDAGPVDEYICLGDTVNYGPWSNECVDLVGSLGAINVRGNHEEYFIQGEYDGRNSLVRTFFEVCFESFDRKREIENTRCSYDRAPFEFAHTLQNRYIFQDTQILLSGNYAIGHTHRQFEISQPPFSLYNVGSVGQNRELINLASYAIIEWPSARVQLRNVPYNEMAVIDEMRLRGFPSQCIEYYLKKPRL